MDPACRKTDISAGKLHEGPWKHKDMAGMRAAAAAGAAST